MSLDRIGTVVRVELLQRVRSVAWYVVLGVFVAILLLITLLAFAAFAFGGGSGWGGGSWFYSIIAGLALLLALLVSPTLSGSAVNGDRDSASLAPVQVTLVTTGELLIGKFLAAWITGLGFLVVAVPFLALAAVGGSVPAPTVITSLAVIIVEIGVVAGLGVAFSALLARPLFSVAATYLVVAALTVGTLIAFGLGGAALRSETTFTTRAPVFDHYDAGPVFGDELRCGPWESSTFETPRFDRVWWILAANPFVILADASPVVAADEGRYPQDLFGQIAYGVRSAQLAPPVETVSDSCAMPLDSGTPEPVRDVLSKTAPSWFAGLLVQIVLVVALFVGGWARTRTPARRLPPGTRVA